MELLLDTNKGYWCSCVGWNMYPINNCEYTIAYKLLYQKLITIKFILINAVSVVDWLIIHEHEFIYINRIKLETITWWLI